MKKRLRDLSNYQPLQNNNDNNDNNDNNNEQANKQTHTNEQQIH